MPTQINIYNWKKEKVDQLSLDSDIFNHEIRFDIISEIVRWQLAKKRQGSHNVKTKAMVRGGGAKPFRQKGTGRARQGSIRSPLLRSGGVAHGPHPRDYSTKLPSKVKKLGMKSLLSYLYSKKLLYVVENMTSKEGKTKELYERFKNFGVHQALLIENKKDVLFSRACKNLKNFQVMNLMGFNVYDALKYKQVIFTKEAISELQTNYKNQKRTS